MVEYIMFIDETKRCKNIRGATPLHSAAYGGHLARLYFDTSWRIQRTNAPKTIIDWPCYIQLLAMAIWRHFNTSLRMLKTNVQKTTSDLHPWLMLTERSAQNWTWLFDGSCFVLGPINKDQSCEQNKLVYLFLNDLWWLMLVLSSS